MPFDFREIDPTSLRVPSSRSSGADPIKLQKQISQFGASAGGMPPLWVYEAADGVLGTRLLCCGAAPDLERSLRGQVACSQGEW